MTPSIQNYSVGRRVSILLSIALLLLFSTPRAKAAPDKYEWILRQRYDELGDLIIYVSHDAAKIVNPSWGYEVVTRAPDWTVHCFRPVEKVEWIGELKNYSGAMINSPFRDGVASTTKVFPSGKGEMKGLRYTRYSQNRQSLNAIYGADEIPVSAGVSEFLSRSSQAPDCGKVPLYRTHVRTQQTAGTHTKESWLALDVAKDMRTGLVIQISTTSWKKVPFNAADFQVPVGLKHVNRMAEVALSPTQKKSFTEVFDGMGFASDQNDGNKKRHRGGVAPDPQRHR